MSPLRGPRALLLSCAIIFSLAICVQAQDCSKLNPCATGCCSKFGYCGTGDDFCGSGNCVDTCDFKLGCDKNNPCKTGCCSKFGFCGLGPDYCSKETCVAGCDSKSYCDPGYGAPGYSEVAICPLNVCCSKYGFCGLTEEFCGDKKIKRPSCSKTEGLARVVGYYEGWSSGRPCNQFYPEQLPLGVYTHLNFAFATIDPRTFAVLPADTSDIDLYRRLTALKRRDPDLKVFIAIGGWTFSDPGATATTFSDLARSESNQKAFFSSLISFMSTYDFDGVDIDWEYPAADDRNGRSEDFENFPTFIRNLKQALRGTGGREGLSITLPASYWYLQHFDIKELVKNVDWFNIMSYDLHGTWDKGNKWTGAFLGAHTNLTEIQDAIDLLWRNDITPDKVVMGLAFYGRAFTASSSSCLEPGCSYESGARPGKCSREISILLNSEIDELISEKHIQPRLYEASAVKVATWDDQWVAYDDADTLKIKVDFAKGQCMGGVMVWAVSHDSAEATHSIALGQIVQRQVRALSMKSVLDDTVTVSTPHAQCKWTGCGEVCPSGYHSMARLDDGNKPFEIMLDNTACDGEGSHTLCCPDNTPWHSCGWFTHNNGKCKSGCKSGYIEVGSNAKYCNNGDYQSACCTIDADKESSVKLYTKCEWPESSNCDEQTCPAHFIEMDTTLALSASGNGGAICKEKPRRLQDHVPRQERSYCCDTSKAEETWKDCQWFDDIGSTPAGRSPDNYCHSACPPDRVRIALDTFGGGCSSKHGGRARCCLPVYNTEEQVSIPENQMFANKLQAFMHNPVCSALEYSPFARRDLVGSFSLNVSIRSDTVGLDALYPREVDKNSDAYYVLQLLMAILINSQLTGDLRAKIDAWNHEIGGVYDNLKIGVLQERLPLLSSWNDAREQIWICEDIVCNMAVWNSTIVDNHPQDSTCGTCSVCDVSPSLCRSDDDDPNTSDADTFLERRLHSSDDDIGPLLEKRNARTLKVRTTVNGITCGVRDIKSATYHSPSEINGLVGHQDIWSKAIKPRSDLPCHDFTTEQFTTGYPFASGKENKFEVEHIVEVQTFKIFLEDAANGVLNSGPAFLSCGFIENGISSSIMIGARPTLSGLRSAIPHVRLYEILGSKLFRRRFWLVQQPINRMKALIWAGIDPIDQEDLLKSMKTPSCWFKSIKTIFLVVDYLNNPSIHSDLLEISEEVIDELELIDDYWNNQNPGNQIRLAAFWRIWFKWFLDDRTARLDEYLRENLASFRDEWKNTDPNGPYKWVLPILGTFEAHAATLRLDTSGL